VVGAGLSTFYVDGAAGSGWAGHVKSLFTAIKATCPSGITWTIPNSYDLLDVVTGTLLGGGTTTGGGTETSGGTGSNFANGVGGRIVWDTAGIFKGRRVRGSTFIVPTVIDYFEGASNLSSVLTGNWATGAAAYLASQADACIYSRPNGGVAGETNLITGATIPDKVSWLRGRRT